LPSFSSPPVDFRQNNEALQPDGYRFDAHFKPAFRLLRSLLCKAHLIEELFSLPLLCSDPKTAT